jgi:hypothetical protein
VYSLGEVFAQYIMLYCSNTNFSAVLGTYFLKEKLGTLGKIGCAICLTGSVIIVLHAPPDEDIQTIDKILEYALQPGNMTHYPLVTQTDPFMQVSCFIAPL